MDTPFFHNIRSEIINRIESARDDITIAMAWFTNNELFDALLQCLKRGVTVSLILMDDVINHADFGVNFNRLTEAGGLFRLYPQDAKMMHNKFCIIDKALTITGSYNWTNYAESRNCENIIITDDTDVAQDYLACFAELLRSTTECQNFEQISLSDLDEGVFISRHHDIYQEVTCLANSKARAEQTEKIEEKKKICHIDQPFPTKGNEPFSIATSPTITAIQGHQHPVSKYNIGFKAFLKEKNDVGMRIMIPKGTSLPCTVSRDAWTNQDDTSEIECEFHCGETDSIHSSKRFSLLKLTNLPKMKSGEVKFKTNITFDTNGYIRVAFICINTGKGQDATCINPEYVEYQ